MSQFQDSINHACGADETQRAAGRFHAGKTTDNFSQARAVESGQVTEIKDDTGLAVKEQLIESQLELFALNSNLERPP